jgi:16S rRNA (guanine1207-N2)-methyltransferase
MSEHYFTRQPQSAEDRRRFQTDLRGFSFHFVTDAGVFSRDGVDEGSRTLIGMMELAPDARVLDVGCGYGPIGLAAARLAPRGHVTMTDINERAAELARENARLNTIANVTVKTGDLFEPVAGETFDAILANPPIRAGKAVVYRLFEEAKSHLLPGGALWVVVHNKQGAPSARAKLEELFGEDAVEEIGKNKGYRVFRAVRRPEQKKI